MLLFHLLYTVIFSLNRFICSIIKSRLMMHCYNLVRHHIKDTILIRVPQLHTPSRSLEVLLLKPLYHYHLGKLVILEILSAF